MENFLKVAKQAAIEAGEIQLSYFGKNKQIYHKAGENDLVTDADKLSEKKILSLIKENFPSHNILAEEGGLSGENSGEFLWVVDPLDGTTNFAHNFPHFAVSIALVQNGEIVLGLVYDVCKNEMFSAVRGSGAFLNENPIKVSTVPSVKKSLLATGFPSIKSSLLEENFVYFKEFVQISQAVRRPGSAALDLCYVAAGRLDGFWELGLSPWDVAAGVCIVREAGGKVTNFGSEVFDYNIKNILSSNSLIHEEMTGVLLTQREYIKNMNLI